MRFRILIVLCLCLTGMGWTETQNPYAILIVGNKGHAEMVRREQVLIAQMGKTLRRQSEDKRLQIFSYHFDQTRERAYCEKQLNVLAEDLLFVGIVLVERRGQSSVPRKVVYRIDRINNPARAAKDVLARAEELEAELVQTQPVTPVPQPQPQPQASETPTISPAPTKKMEPGWRIQLGSFSQLKYAEEQAAELEGIGYEASINRANNDSAALFKVTIGPFEDKAAASKALDELKTKGFEQAFLVEVPPATDGE